MGIFWEWANEIKVRKFVPQQYSQTSTQLAKPVVSFAHSPALVTILPPNLQALVTEATVPSMVSSIVLFENKLLYLLN